MENNSKLGIKSSADFQHFKPKKIKRKPLKITDGKIIHHNLIMFTLNLDFNRDVIILYHI